MPTHTELPGFLRDYVQLTAEQRAAFRSALILFREGLQTQRFHPSLRLKKVQGHPRVWELSWAADGRATFQYGEELRPGDPHIVWRRIGTHAVFREP